jgi:hypothetical protein
LTGSLARSKAAIERGDFGLLLIFVFVCATPPAGFLWLLVCREAARESIPQKPIIGHAMAAFRTPH